MPTLFKEKSEAVAPTQAAASSNAQNPGHDDETAGPRQAQTVAAAPAEAEQTPGKLIKAVLISLFVCPGFGHRHLGRSTAAWVVLGLFLASFTYLGVTVNHLAQEAVKQMQTHRSADPFAIVTKIENLYKTDPDVDWALKFLLVIYFGAPVELAYTWWQNRSQKAAS